jgi:Fe-S cluster assembly iron-binding protein IscA
MTLDESQEHDVQLAEKGVQFVLDPFAVALIDAVEIQYDQFVDDFVVRVPNGPMSSC